MQGDRTIKHFGLMFASVVALPLTLGGCAIVPPLVGAIAYGIDGISLVVSGKTTTDHAVSAMAEQDCRLWRLLLLEAICRPEEGEPDTAIAVAEAAVEASPASVPAALSRTAAPASVPVAALTAPAPSSSPIEQPRAKPGAGLRPPVTFDAPRATEPPTVVAARAPETTPSAAAAERYLVLGTFRQRGNAESLAGRLLDTGAVITAPEPGIGQFHRVVIGPLATAELPRLRQHVQARGVTGAWTATLCLNANAVELPCGVPMAVPPATQTAAAPTPRAVMPVAQVAARTLTLSTDPIY